MKYTKGDKVAIKNSQKEGRIVRYLSDTTVEIALRDNTLIEVEEDELEYPYLKWFRQESQKKDRESIKRYEHKEVSFEQERKTQGLLLGFWPEYFSADFEDLIDNIRLYFYNDTADEIEFFYSYQDDSIPLLEVKKHVSSYENFYLHSIPFDNLSAHPRLSLKLAPAGETLATIPIKLQPKKIYEELIQLHDQNLPAFYKKIGDDIYEIYSPDIETKTPNIPSPALTPQKTQVAAPDTVLDLHLEVLYPEDYGSIRSTDALDIQLAAFREFLAEGIQKHQSKITVVHGIGRGKLRDQIHTLLDQNPFVKKYQNELHPLYGYGSTEIWLK